MLSANAENPMQPEDGPWDASSTRNDDLSLAAAAKDEMESTPVDSAAEPQQHQHQHQPSRRRGLGAAMVHTASARWQTVQKALMGMRSLQLLSAVAKQDKMDFLKASGEAIESVADGSLDVKLEVKNVKDLKSINYLQQGDATFYTPDALVKRHDVRHAPQVVAAIKAWWDWMPLSDPSQNDQKISVLHGGRASPTSVSEISTTSKVVCKAVYCAMVVLIQLVLMPRFGLKADKKYDPSEDWESDCKGHAAMHYPDFFDALFELADMWCDTVGADEYSELLMGLLDDAKKAQDKKGTFAALLKKWGYKGPMRTPEPISAAPPPPPPVPPPTKVIEDSTPAAVPDPTRPPPPRAPSPLSAPPLARPASAAPPQQRPVSARPATAVYKPPKVYVSSIPRPSTAPGPHVPRARLTFSPVPRTPQQRQPLSPDAGPARFPYQKPAPKAPPSPPPYLPDFFPPPAIPSDMIADRSLPLLRGEGGRPPFDVPGEGQRREGQTDLGLAELMFDAPSAWRQGSVDSVDLQAPASPSSSTTTTTTPGAKGQRELSDGPSWHFWASAERRRPSTALAGRTTPTDRSRSPQQRPGTSSPSGRSPSGGDGSELTATFAPNSGGEWRPPMSPLSSPRASPLAGSLFPPMQPGALSSSGGSAATGGTASISRGPQAASASASSSQPQKRSFTELFGAGRGTVQLSPLVVPSVLNTGATRGSSSPRHSPDSQAAPPSTPVALTAAAEASAADDEAVEQASQSDTGGSSEDSQSGSSYDDDGDDNGAGGERVSAEGTDGASISGEMSRQSAGDGLGRALSPAALHTDGASALNDASEREGSVGATVASDTGEADGLASESDLAAVAEASVADVAESSAPGSGAAGDGAVDGADEGRSVGDRRDPEEEASHRDPTVAAPGPDAAALPGGEDRESGGESAGCLMSDELGASQDPVSKEEDASTLAGLVTIHEEASVISGGTMEDAAAHGGESPADDSAVSRDDGEQEAGQEVGQDALLQPTARPWSESPFLLVTHPTDVSAPPSPSTARGTAAAGGGGGGGVWSPLSLPTPGSPSMDANMRFSFSRGLSAAGAGDNGGGGAGGFESTSPTRHQDALGHEPEGTLDALQLAVQRAMERHQPHIFRRPAGDGASSEAPLRLHGTAVAASSPHRRSLAVLPVSLPSMVMHSPPLTTGDRRLYSASAVRRPASTRPPKTSAAAAGAAAALTSTSPLARPHTAPTAAAAAAARGRFVKLAVQNMTSRTSHHAAFGVNSSWAKQAMPTWCVPLGPTERLKNSYTAAGLSASVLQPLARP